MSSNRGGKRQGAGRKPGSKNKVTIENKATITELAKKYSGDAMKTLHEISISGNSETARIAAANSILDRAHGKPASHEARPEIEANNVNKTSIDTTELARKVLLLAFQGRPKLDS